MVDIHWKICIFYRRLKRLIEDFYRFFLYQHLLHLAHQSEWLVEVLILSQAIININTVFV